MPYSSYGLGAAADLWALDTPPPKDPVKVCIDCGNVVRCGGQKRCDICADLRAQEKIQLRWKKQAEKRRAKKKQVKKSRIRRA